MLYKLEDRSGKSFTIDGDHLDAFRLEQLQGQWHPAGLVCCRIGIANPFGMFAERKEIKLSLAYVNENHDGTPLAYGC